MSFLVRGEGLWGWRQPVSSPVFCGLRVNAGTACLYDERKTCDRNVSSYAMPLYRNFECSGAAWISYVAISGSDFDEEETMRPEMARTEETKQEKKRASLSFFVPQPCLVARTSVTDHFTTPPQSQDETGATRSSKPNNFITLFFQGVGRI